MPDLILPPFMLAAKLERWRNTGEARSVFDIGNAIGDRIRGRGGCAGQRSGLDRLATGACASGIAFFPSAMRLDSGHAAKLPCMFEDREPPVVFLMGMVVAEWSGQ